MKRTSEIILGVIVLLCFASVASYFQAVPNRAPNTAYTVGALVMFQNVEYRCIQARTSRWDGNQGVGVDVATGV